MNWAYYTGIIMATITKSSLTRFPTPFPYYEKGIHRKEHRAVRFGVRQGKPELQIRSLDQRLPISLGKS